MVLRLHYYHFQRHFVKNCASGSYNSRTHTIRIQDHPVCKSQQFREGAFYQDVQTQIKALYLPRTNTTSSSSILLIITIRIHEHDQVHGIQGEFQCHHLRFMPNAKIN